MPPRGVKSPKRKRQYSHIKASARKRGVSEERAEEIAARTVNKERREAGETKTARKRGGTKTRSARKTSARSSKKTARRTSRKTGRKTSRKRTSR